MINRQGSPSLSLYGRFIVVQKCCCFARLPKITGWNNNIGGVSRPRPGRAAKALPRSGANAVCVSALLSPYFQDNRGRLKEDCRAICPLESYVSDIKGVLGAGIEGIYLLPARKDFFQIFQSLYMAAFVHFAEIQHFPAHSG